LMRFRKYTWMLMVGAMLFAACGPKKATKETLTQLEECNSALESAEARKAELESSINSLEANINAKKSRIEALQSERDSLNYWLHEVLEKGY